MNGYGESQKIVIDRIQAERRAEAAAERMAAESHRAQAKVKSEPTGQRVGWFRRTVGLRPALTPVGRR